MMRKSQYNGRPRVAEGDCFRRRRRRRRLLPLQSIAEQSFKLSFERRDVHNLNTSTISILHFEWILLSRLFNF